MAMARVKLPIIELQRQRQTEAGSHSSAMTGRFCIPLEGLLQPSPDLVYRSHKGDIYDDAMRSGSPCWVPVIANKAERLRDLDRLIIISGRLVYVCSERCERDEGTTSPIIG